MKDRFVKLEIIVSIKREVLKELQIPLISPAESGAELCTPEFMSKILAVVSIQDISILMRLLCKELKLCATAGRKAAYACCGRRLAEKIWILFPSCFFSSSLLIFSHVFCVRSR